MFVLAFHGWLPYGMLMRIALVAYLAQAAVGFAVGFMLPWFSWFSEPIARTTARPSAALTNINLNASTTQLSAIGLQARVVGKWPSFRID
jgi:hypothetical protein